MTAIVETPSQVETEERLEYIVQHRTLRSWADGSVHETPQEAHRLHVPGRTRVLARRVVVMTKVVMT